MWFLLPPTGVARLSCKMVIVSELVLIYSCMSAAGLGLSKYCVLTTKWIKSSPRKHRLWDQQKAAIWSPVWRCIELLYRLQCLISPLQGRVTSPPLWTSSCPNRRRVPTGFSFIHRAEQRLAAADTPRRKGCRSVDPIPALYQNKA